MSESNNRVPFLRRIAALPARFLHWLSDSWHMAGVHLRNSLRKMRRASVDYVIIVVGGPLPERAGPRRGFWERWLPLWPAASLSMQQLNGRLRAIADADNVKGVLLIFRGIDGGLSTVQNLRRSLERLREAGKESIVFTPYLDLRHYFAASAADRIYAPPGATFDVLGLNSEVVFLKDALKQIGVEVDVVQISPYKTAFDTLQHMTMTPEYRQQMDWLLDDLFDTVTTGMAEGRGMEQRELIELVNQAPHFAEDAVELGLIDGVAYEDELAHLLAPAWLRKPASRRANGQSCATGKVPVICCWKSRADSRGASSA